MSHTALAPPALAAWNALSSGAAEAAVLPCNGSQMWARLLSAKRPFVTCEELFPASDSIWRELPEADRQQAFDSHPRLGGMQARAASPQSLNWSAGEQSGLGFDEEAESALAAANQAYEARFGRIFLVCATGKSAAEILALLQRRMADTPEAELKEAAEQQRRITQLRLRKWLGLPPARCDDV